MTKLKRKKLPSELARTFGHPVLGPGLGLNLRQQPITPSQNYKTRVRTQHDGSFCMVRTFSMIPDSNTTFEFAEAAAAAAAAAAKVFAAFLGLEPPLPPPPPPPVEELDDIGFSRRHDNFDEFTSLASCK